MHLVWGHTWGQSTCLNVQKKKLTLLFEAENYLDVARLTGKSIGVYIMTERWIHIAQTYQTKQLI